MSVIDQKKYIRRRTFSEVTLDDGSVYPEPDAKSHPGPRKKPFEDVPRSVDGLRVSEEEYWEKYYHDPDVTYEWNNGILEEKPIADVLSAKMYRWFLALMEEYLKAHPIATLILLEIGFRLALPEKTSIRRPDLGVVLHTNPVPVHDEDCTYRGVCDLCIEFLSDSTPQDVKRDTVEKKSEYAQGGVKEYYILDRKGKESAFYRLSRSGLYVPIPQIEGTVRSEVLPGFQFRIADLYSHPEFIDRIDDPVYRAFILPAYQASEQRVEAERQRAEVERQHAEVERQRAEVAERRVEELAAKLRALGIEF
jgi:hypothetical protein